MSLRNRGIEFDRLLSRFHGAWQTSVRSCKSIKSDHIVGVRQSGPSQSVLWIESDCFSKTFDSGKQTNPSLKKQCAPLQVVFEGLQGAFLLEKEAAQNPCRLP